MADTVALTVKHCPYQPRTARHSDHPALHPVHACILPDGSTKAWVVPPLPANLGIWWLFDLDGLHPKEYTHTLAQRPPLIYNSPPMAAL